MIAPNVERAARCCERLSISLRMSRWGFDFLCLLHPFSDKSWGSSKRGGLCFYSLYACILNFLKSLRRGHISPEKTNIGYFPTLLYESGSVSQWWGGAWCYQDVQKASCFSWMHRKGTSDCRKHYSVSPTVYKKYGTRLRANFAIDFYVGGIPEARDILTMRHCVKTFSPAQNCPENVDFSKLYDRVNPWSETD